MLALLSNSWQNASIIRIYLMLAIEYIARIIQIELNA